MRAFKPRKNTCKVCRAEFVASKPMQKVCGPLCAVAYAKAERAKSQRKEAVKQRAEARQKLKTRGDYIREAQTAFNAFIRARDAGKPCICCGQTSNGQTRGGEWDAGHYRSRGAAPHLRFDERNCHAQLKQCNRYKAGNVVGYRAGLIERIGLEAVEALEADHEPRKWSSDDLVEIKRTYQRKVREMKKEAA